MDQSLTQMDLCAYQYFTYKMIFQMCMYRVYVPIPTYETHFNLYLITLMASVISSLTPRYILPLKIPNPSNINIHIWRENDLLKY